MTIPSEPGWLSFRWDLVLTGRRCGDVLKRDPIDRLTSLLAAPVRFRDELFLPGLTWQGRLSRHLSCVSRQPHAADPVLNSTLTLSLLGVVFRCFRRFRSINQSVFIMYPLRRHIFVCFMAKSAFLFFWALAP